MDILYVSSACDKDRINYYNNLLKNKLSYAHTKFHNLIIDGLRENNCNVTYLVGLPVCRNEKLIWKKEVSNFDTGMYYQSGFINLPVIKQICIQRSIKKQVKKWLKLHKNGLVILDMTYASIVSTITKMIKKYNVKLIGISPDVYEYMADVKKITPQNDLVSKIMKSKLKKAYSLFDGYIFLTEQMNKILNLSNKPYIIMEGIVDNKDFNVIDYKNREKIILYAGGLSKRFGVEDLIYAFKSLKDQDIKLYLYGSGELEDFIVKEENNDSRIKYFGSVSNDEVVLNEKNSYILVNPRKKSEEYTKYSFPSKLMEYLLSGTVVLTTKLPGIPKEYDKYLFYISNLKEDIEKILKTNTKKLNSISKDGHYFVLNNKNYIVQTKKIIEFGEKI